MAKAEPKTPRRRTLTNDGKAIDVALYPDEILQIDACIGFAKTTSRRDLMRYLILRGVQQIEAQKGSGELIPTALPAWLLDLGRRISVESPDVQLRIKKTIEAQFEEEEK